MASLCFVMLVFSAGTQLRCVGGAPQNPSEKNLGNQGARATQGTHTTNAPCQQRSATAGLERGWDAAYKGGAFCLFFRFVTENKGGRGFFSWIFGFFFAGECELSELAAGVAAVLLVLE